jgi:hypothetical protein
LDNERKATIRTMVENYHTQLNVIEKQPDLSLEEYLKNLGLDQGEIKFGLSIAEEKICSRA